MKIAKQNNMIDEVAVFQRFDDIAQCCDGLLHFNERDVFIASGTTRTLVNALPDIVNIFEHFSFEWAKARIYANNTLLGPSMFDSEAIEDAAGSDLAVMAKGKEREMFYELRKAMENHLKAGIGLNKTGQLNDIPDTLSHVATVRVEKQDELITEMVNSNVFSDATGCEAMKLQTAVVAATADMICTSVAAEDFELTLDVLRIMLRF